MIAKVIIPLCLACFSSTILLAPWVALGNGRPGDIYFSFAVTENSRNHTGDNLLFLDFQDQVDTDAISDRVVISPRIKQGSIRLDGRLDDWNPTYLTVIHGRVMNNYPLGRHYDAVPADIRIGAAFDGHYVYFVVNYVDANHDASVDAGRWVFDGKRWRPRPHVKAGENTPSAKAANAGDRVTGVESEDRIYFMFPIVDKQRNFRPNGLGCAMYCHSNLKMSGDPKKKLVGEGVAGMHTIVPGDRADLWRWESSTTLPMDTLEDGHLIYGEGPGFHGRRDDHGLSNHFINDGARLKLKKIRGPVFMHVLDLMAGRYGKANHRTEPFTMELALPIPKGQTFAKGVSLPSVIGRRPTGSRGDVTAVGRFDPRTFSWTVEFRRVLNTGDATDHQFVPSSDQAPPENPIAVRGDPERGENLYVNKGCDTCHGDTGKGKNLGKRWVFPRIQRTSGALISKTVKFNQEMRGRVASLIRAEIRKKTTLVMPDIDISEQEAEDIAAWLQTQHVPVGQ